MKVAQETAEAEEAWGFIVVVGDRPNMSLPRFESGDEIFLDEDVLRDSHTPETLIERDEELQEYHAALKPVANGSRPRNIFVYGQTGVGKTVATKLILNQLQSDVEHEIDVTWLTCKSLDSSYQVAAHLVNEFREPDNQINTSGYPTGQIYQMLWKEMESVDASHCLIVLDEIDSIGSDDGLLYEVPRANDNGSVDVDATKIGVIGISNNFVFRDNLSARVKDSLCDVEVHFPPYDANELQSILRQRAELAFIDSVLDDGVIELCGALAGQESGSARHALSLLYQAGDLARQDGSEQVEERHVRDADPMIRENKVQRELESLPTQSHLTLLAVLLLARQDDLPARSNDIYDVYRDAAERVGADVKTSRTIRDRLSELSLKGFLEAEERNQGLAGGSFFEYRWGGVEMDVVESVLQESSTVGDLIQSESSAVEE